MNDKTDNLSEMIKRALAAQAELGVGELVLKSGQKLGARKTASVLAASSEVVSVNEALATQTDQVGLPDIALPIANAPEFQSIKEHFKAICDCQKCPLGQTRNNFVYGVGNPNADIMFVGEAPGADEDAQGEPFVGRAGKLLDKILAAMTLSRDDVYIANILKCRPPGNRDPQPDEMAKCFPYLREQVRLVRPKIICGLGRIAAQALLETTLPLGRLRRVWHQYEGVPMMVTYHPAALLRFQKYKKDTWEDMQMLMTEYENMK